MMLGGKIRNENRRIEKILKMRGEGGRGEERRGKLFERPEILFNPSMV